MAQNGPTSKEPTVRIGGVGDASHTLQTEIVAASQVCSVEECESYDTNMQKASSVGREHFESPSCMEKERESNIVMMKGFLKSNEDEAPSLALTLANHKHGHEDRDKNLISRNRNQDQGCKTMGFHSLFQSLYCPKTKAQETVA